MKKRVVAACLENHKRDVLLLQERDEFKRLNLTCEDGQDASVFCWKVRIVGAKNTYWENQEYDLNIHFGRDFPMDPPKLHFPNTPTNQRSIRHPLVGRNGDLHIASVSKDGWACKTVVDIILEVQELFSTNLSDHLLAGPELSPLLLLPVEPLLVQVVEYMSLEDILSLSCTCKKALLVLHSNSLWAKLYYARCEVPAPLLYYTGASGTATGAGPLRECSDTARAQFQWRHAREAYIRAHQCSQIEKMNHLPSMEVFAACDVAALLPLAYPDEFAQKRNQPRKRKQAVEPSGNTNLDPQTGNVPDWDLEEDNMEGNQAFMFAGVALHQQQAEPDPAPVPQPVSAPYPTPLHRDLNNRLREALRYRVLRSARLARWLGGPKCLDAHLAHSYWSHYPATTLLYLCSATAGDFAPTRTHVVACMRVEAYNSGLDARRETCRLPRRLQHARGLGDSGDSSDGSGDETTNTTAGGASSTSYFEEYPLLEDQAYLLKAMARLGRMARLKIVLVGRLLQEGVDGIQDKQTKPAASDSTQGPDIYDFIEALHEVNIVYSNHFRDFLPGLSEIDCKDKNGDWVEAVVTAPAETSPALVTPPPSFMSPLALARDGLHSAAEKTSGSQFLSFSGLYAQQHFTRFCTQLEEEQHAEYGLSASYAVVSAVIESVRQDALNSGCDAAERNKRIALHSDSVRRYAEELLAPMSMEQLYSRAVPILSLWQAVRSTPRGLTQSFAQDIVNNGVRSGHGQVVPAEHQVRQYDAFNFARRSSWRHSVTVRFPGFDNRFNERLAVTSARVAPFRTHTSRAHTMHTSAVGEILLRAQDQASGVSSERHTQSVANQQHPFDVPGTGLRADAHAALSRSATAASSVGLSHTPAQIASSSSSMTRQPSGTFNQTVFVEFQVRCLWLCSQPGGGMVRYKAPAHTKLLAVVQDFCEVQRLSLAQVRAARLDMIACVRHVYERRADGGGLLQRAKSDQPGVLLLNHASSLEELGAQESEVIDILYYPSKCELV